MDEPTVVKKKPSIAQQIRRALNNELKTFKVFERTIALVCITIPAILWLADKGTTGFRSSISNYVYMDRSYIFGMLLCTAAMLFIFNGAVYFRNDNKLNINKHGKWYNVILGLSLLGVILFPHEEYAIPHYIFAGIFFLGSAVFIGIFHQKKDRKISITLAVITITCILLHFIIGIPLFWAEWLSLTVIGVHFILESKGILSYAFVMPTGQVSTE